MKEFSILCMLGFHYYTKWRSEINAKYENRHCKRCYKLQRRKVI
jgi:hypothetical protein